jgi:hypothetical protein
MIVICLVVFGLGNVSSVLTRPPGLYSILFKYRKENDMAILADFISFYLRKSEIEKRFPGGISSFRNYFRTPLEDEHLFGYTFMDEKDANNKISKLSEYGFKFDHSNPGTDIGMIIQPFGKYNLCDWLEVGVIGGGDISAAWLKGTEPGKIICPDYMIESMYIGYIQKIETLLNKKDLHKSLCTHGGKAKKFDWDFIQDQIVIKNIEGKQHKYDLLEVKDILSKLYNTFGNDWFPLANNVEKLGNGTEKDGLGSFIFSIKPGDITHAQGASYLGVVLEKAGILRWNQQIKGIEWKITFDSINDELMTQAYGASPYGKFSFCETVLVDESLNSSPYTIDIHKHNFAVWAAARAVQRHFTKTEKIRDALNTLNIQKEISLVQSGEMGAKDYDVWHSKICKNLIMNFKKLGIQNVTYGRAAKLIAIYIKVTVIMSNQNCDLAKIAHPPIDRILLKNIAKKYMELNSLTSINWTSLSEKKYFEVIESLRNILPVESPFWKIEQYWII